MERGMVDNNLWVSGTPFGPLKKLAKISIWPQKRKIEVLTAWRCPQCRSIKLQSEETAS